MDWFRLYTEARNDAKLRALSDGQHRVWFNLLCFAAERDGDERGTFAAADLDLLAVEVANADTDLLTETLDRLERLRIVAKDATGTGYVFCRFRDRQYDKPSALPERVRERVARHRQRKAVALQGVTAVTGNARERDDTHEHVKLAAAEGEKTARSNPLYKEGNAAVTRSNTTDTDTDTDTDTEKRRTPLPPTNAPGKPVRAALVPVIAKPNKYADFIDAVHAQGLPYESEPADARAVKQAAPSAAQIAECYGALARGEWGDDWTRGRLSAQTAVKSWNAYQTAKTVPRREQRGRGGKRDAFGELADEIERLERTRNGVTHDHAGGPAAAADDPFDGLLAAAGTNGTARSGGVPQGTRQVAGELPHRRLA